MCIIYEWHYTKILSEIINNDTNYVFVKSYIIFYKCPLRSSDNNSLDYVIDLF